MKIKNLENILALLGFNGDVLVSNNLDLTIGFRLRLPEVLSCSREKLYSLHDTFQRMINLLPPGTLLHKQDLFQLREFQGEDNFDRSKNEIAASLNNSYLQHFEGRESLSHECFLYISLLNRGLLKSYLESALILSRRKRQADKLRFDQLDELKGNVIAILSQNGIGCQVLKGAEAGGDENSLGLIERFLKPELYR